MVIVLTMTSVFSFPGRTKIVTIVIIEDVDHLWLYQITFSVSVKIPGFHYFHFPDVVDRL